MRCINSKLAVQASTRVILGSKPGKHVRAKPPDRVAQSKSIT
jgi:hypothetical protein